MLAAMKHKDDYRFGFNGQEKDNEIKGIGNSLDFQFRMYDSRLGKFLSIDPLTSDYPHYTPYQFAGNTPIQAIDIEGAEELKITEKAEVFYGSVMLVMRNDKELKALLSEISRPDRRAKQLVYLTTGSTGSSNGNTSGRNQNIKQQAKFLANYNTLVKSKKYKAYSNIKKMELINKKIAYSNKFTNWGINYNEVANAVQDEVYVITVNDYNAKKYLRSATKTAVHEMDFHLKNDLNGISKTQEQEHSENYNIPLGSEEDRKHGISEGYSPDDSYVKPNSRAGVLFQAVDRSINSLIKNIFRAKKK